jgi:hypothetical protein
MSGRIGLVKTAGMAWVAPVGAPSLPRMVTVGREAIVKVETWTSVVVRRRNLVMEWEVARLAKFHLNFFLIHIKSLIHF